MCGTMYVVFSCYSMICNCLLRSVSGHNIVTTMYLYITHIALSLVATQCLTAHYGKTICIYIHILVEEEMQGLVSSL